MDFTHKKLPPEAAENLRNVPVATVTPYTLMLAPVYAYLRKNQKFVAVKAPLDFFTSEELQRLAVVESLFFPHSIDAALPFQNAAARVRAILSIQPPDETKLPPAPYELSDAILRVLGPLWGRGTVIEPYFISVFANDLCAPISITLLKKARDTNIDLYERSLFRSSWAVFLALHLGYCDLPYLSRLRQQVFEQTTDNVESISPVVREVDELFNLTAETVKSSKTKILSGDYFTPRTDRLSQKITSRLARVSAEMINPDAPVPSVYGKGGFTDV